MRNTSTISSHYNADALSWEFYIQKQDSIFPVSYRPYLMSDSIVVSTPPNYFRPTIFEREYESPIAPLVCCTLFFILFAFIRLRSKDLIFNVLQVLVNRKKTDLIQNEGILPNITYYILTLLLSLSVLATGITYVLCGELIFKYVFLLLGVLIVYHFLLLVLFRLLDWTFKSPDLFEEAVINLWTFNIMSGLLIAPFVLAIFLVKAFSVAPIIKIAIFSLILIYLVKILRWVQILFIHRVSIFYMILYLCAFEAMPILVLYKLFA